MELNLDYTLNQAQRIEYTHTLPLEQLKPSQLEYLATYILHNDIDPLTERNEPDIPTTPVEAKNTPKTRKPLNWNDPLLAQHKCSKEHLTAQIEQSTDLRKIAQLKKWRRELSEDAGIYYNLSNPTMPSNPTFTQLVEPPIDELVDFTNSFHIKHLLLNYSQLRQSSTDTALFIDEFDSIIDFAHTHGKLTDWQMYLIIRRIDGIHQILIAKELAEKYNKIMSPTTMSTSMRTIYQTIAKAAEQMELERNDKRPSQRRYCPKCGRHLYNNNYHWYTKRASCIQCERSKQK